MVKKEIIEEMIKLQRWIDRDRRQYELDAWMHLHLSIGQLKSLFFISNQGSTSLGQLAKALEVTPTNTSGIVDRLMKRGLITRTENADDRRLLVLRTTIRGDELITQLRQKRKAHLNELFNHLSDKDAKTVLESLKILADIIKTHQIDSIG